MHGDTPRLILTITRACNLRCGFCPLELGPWNMEPDVAAKAVAVYKKRFAAPHHVRMFGGEPLLRFDLLKNIVASFPNGGKPGGARFSFPTNGTLISPEVVAFLREHSGVEAAVSRVEDSKTLASLPNVLINMCIPQEGAKDLVPYVAKLLKAGITRLNFLPAFFSVWTDAQVADLEKSFRLTAELIQEWERRGTKVDVRNLETFNPVPLYNHGMVVDVDGEVFPSNAVFCRDFKPLRERLRMGTVHDPDGIDWNKADGIDWHAVFREGLADDVYDSTMRVNALLTDLVENLKQGRSGHAPATVAA